MTRTKAQTLWVSAMLALISLTGWDLYYSYQRKAQLKEELALSQAQETEARAQAEQQQQQYLSQLELWRQTTARIEEVNKERIAGWQRTIRQQHDRQQVLAAQKVQPASPPPAADMVLDDEGNLVVVAPAAAPPMVQVEVTLPPPPRLETAPPPPEPPAPTVIEISASEGIRIELQKDTSWQTILQLLVLILVTYGGIKIINRFSRDPTPA